MINLSDRHKKAITLSGVGAGLGAALGFYLFGGHQGNFLDIAPTIMLGMSFGWLGALTLGKNITPTRIRGVETNVLLVVAFLSFSLALAGLIGFFKTKEAMGIIGAVFFALCGTYLVSKARAKRT